MMKFFNNNIRMNIILCCVILFQWIIFTFLMNQQYTRETILVNRFIALESSMKRKTDEFGQQQQQLKEIHDQQQQQEQQPLPPLSDNNLLTKEQFIMGSSSNRTETKSLPPSSILLQQPLNDNNNKIDNYFDTNYSDNNNNHVKGVFVTIMYKSPKWFHLRYKSMIDNALINLPIGWKIQIFINPLFITMKDFYSWHPALYRMFVTQSHPNVIVTILPSNMTSRGIKPKDIMLSEWFWNTLISNHVVLFSGNGAFCSNHVIDPNIFYNYLINHTDYCGTPWNTYNGIGGDGSSHSYRNRNAMLRMIQYNKQQKSNNSKVVSTEFRHTIDTMYKMNQEIENQHILQQQEDNNINETIATTNRSLSNGMNNQLFRFGTIVDTIQFGGVHNISNNTHLIRLPILVAGIQDRLTYAERDTLLKHCIELKSIFPSLHEPSCFGAHPKPTKCKESICALQDHIPSSGC